MINIDNSRPMDTSVLSSQINSHDYYRIVTSRHSRNRREYLAGANGIMTPGVIGDHADESGTFDLNANLNMTHDFVKTPNEVILGTTDGRKDFNLTNLSIKINQVNESGPVK